MANKIPQYEVFDDDSVVLMRTAKRRVLKQRIRRLPRECSSVTVRLATRKGIVRHKLFRHNGEWLLDYTTVVDWSQVTTGEWPEAFPCKEVPEYFVSRVGSMSLVVADDDEEREKCRKFHEALARHEASKPPVFC